MATKKSSKKEVENTARQDSPAEIEDLSRPPLQKASNTWREVVTTLALLAAAIFIAFFTKAYIIQPYVVDGQSMENTLQNGDRLLVDKLPRTIAGIDGHAYIPHRGDIIIFNQSNLPGYTGTKQLIKRVIGLPGEHIVVKNGRITVFNSDHPSGFNPDTSGGYHIDAASTPGGVDLTLKPDQLFVCGDNRPNSEDSRYFGPINTSQVVGKLWVRILPISKAKAF